MKILKKALALKGLDVKFQKEFKVEEKDLKTDYKVLKYKDRLDA